MSAASGLRIDLILMDAFRVPWSRRRAFAKGLAFPAAAIVAFQCAFWHFSPEPEWASWVALGVRAALWVIFAVICHRLVLLDPPERDIVVVPRWTWRETRFLLWFLAAYAVVLAGTWVAVMAVAFVGGNVFAWMPLSQPILAAGVPAAGTLLTTYLFARLAVVLPAAAIDARPSLRRAWELTRGNGLRMVVIVGALPWLVRYATWWLYSDEPTLAEVALVTALGVALIAYEIAALSLAYRGLGAAATAD